MIHSAAIISDSAKIAENVEIGAYSVIGPNVEIDSGTWIGPHVVINSNTKIGKNNKIYQFSSVGGDNQDLTPDDKPTYLEIGDDNIIHEFVTINRGSVKEKCLTLVGDGNLFMAYSHVGHDCIIENDTIFANGATLAGHVLVQNHATIGAYCAIHQFCNIGAYSFIARGAMVVKDILPYVMASGNDPKVHGLNIIGLKRAGFDRDVIKSLLQAYKIIFRNGKTINDALIELQLLANQCEEITQLIQALNRAMDTERGIIR